MSAHCHCYKACGQFHKGTAYLCEELVCVFTKVGRTFVKLPKASSQPDTR